MHRAAESAGAWEHSSEETGFDVEENVYFKNAVNNKMKVRTMKNSLSAMT